MADPVHGFTESGVRRIVSAVRAVENLPTPQQLQNMPLQTPRVSCFVQLGAVIAHPLWSATEVISDGASGFAAPAAGARIWNATMPLLVLGVPEPQLAAGLVLRADITGASSGKARWVAVGMERRVLDWGTGNNVSPFIVEDVSGTLTARIKTKKTTNGYTWTAEKIDMDGGECL